MNNRKGIATVMGALLVSLTCLGCQQETPSTASQPPSNEASTAQSSAPAAQEIAPDEPLPQTPPGVDIVANSPASAASTDVSSGTPHEVARQPEPLASPDRPASAEHSAASHQTSQEASTQPAHARASKKKSKKNPVGKDYVALNGPIFENWTVPQAALLISGEQWGFLEPCGCAGLENQKGGLSRRHTLIKVLGEAGWPLGLLDLGGQVRRFGPQAEIKFRMAIGALTDIGYSTVGFGPQDLRLSTENLLGVVVNLPNSKSPFVSANVDFGDLGELLTTPYRVLTLGNRRVGVTSILGPSYQRRINSPDVKFLDPAESLRPVVERLQAEADFLVLLAHATPEESQALARRFPQFQVVVTAGGADEPPREAERIPDTQTTLIEVGHKGMYVAILGLYDDEQMPVRYQRVPLDGRFADSDEMKQMMQRYQQELQTLGLTGLGLTSKQGSTRPHPSGHKFIGSEACADCHTQAFEVWENSPHAHATQTLVDLKPARHYDPECLSCHVTGWEPQRYFPFESGYLDLTKTAALRTNGCENCHGPAREHVLAETGEIDASDEEIAALRKALHMELVDGEAEGKVVGAVTQNCLQCHDLDNSPDFKFETYWKEVEHYGKD